MIAGTIPAGKETTAGQVASFRARNTVAPIPAPFRPFAQSIPPNREAPSRTHPVLARTEAARCELVAGGMRLSSYPAERRVYPTLLREVQLALRSLSRSSPVWARAMALRKSPPIRSQSRRRASESVRRTTLYPVLYPHMIPKPYHMPPRRVFRNAVIAGRSCLMRGLMRVF